MKKTPGMLPLPALSAKRIFLVEDAATVRDLIRDSLDGVLGLEWAGFSDTEDDAFAWLREHCCDVLIVDIELKTGNGISLLRKLAKENLYRDELKIIFSNNVCEAYRRAGHECGVQHFFDKSFDMPRLSTLLERLGSDSIQKS